MTSLIHTLRFIPTRAGLLCAAIVVTLLAFSPADAYDGKDCSGAFAVRLSDGRVFVGRQTVTVPVGPGVTAQVSGRFVDFTLNLDTFKVSDYAMNSNITGGQRKVIFARKEPLHGRTLDGALSIDLNNEQLVMRRSGSRIDMKIQAKDCSEGGIFQMEPEQTTEVLHELGAGFSYCLDSLNRVLITSPSSPFIGRESPEAAALVAPSPAGTIVGANLSRWLIQGGGRMGMVTGEDAFEPLPFGSAPCSSTPTGPTPTPTASPSPSPTATPTPSPQPTPLPGEEVRVSTRLGGAPINGFIPKGEAEFRLRADGSRRIKVEIEDVNRPAGTVFNVLVDNRRIGQIVLGPALEGELELNTNNGHSVPPVTNGTTVVVTDQGGAIIVAGAFNATPPAPGATPLPTPQPTPGDEIRFGTTLAGATLNGVMPQGVAEFRLRADGIRRLKVEVEDVNLPLGTQLSVLLNGREVVKMFVSSLLKARIELNTNDDQVVPASVAGASVTVVNGAGVVIAAGTFPATQTYGNPLEDRSFYVRQQYVDFLGRGPDETGLNNWTATLAACPDDGYGTNNPSCDRVHVSASFYLSDEFRGRGYWAYRFYEVGHGRRPRYGEFLPDMVRVGGAQSPEREALSKSAFVDDFVQRAEFRQKYDRPEFQDASAFVNELERTARVTLSNKAALVAALQGGQKSRGQVLREVVESREVEDRFFVEAFVAMQYFGYLRRDPDEVGYANWVRTLRERGDFRHMIFGFIYATEYRGRFGQP